MVNSLFILIRVVILCMFSTASLFAQETNQTLPSGDLSEKMKDISHVVIKVDQKMYDFEMDTLDVGYKTILQIEPDWIESIDVLKNKQPDGQTKTYLILNLREGTFKKLPADMRSKFY